MSKTNTTKSAQPTRTYEFSLVLDGAKAASAEIEDALYEAGCDDALLGSRNGVLFLDFNRRAQSLTEAVLSAAADVNGANAGVRVARVEPDDLVSASEIARRVGRSRESIRQLVHGDRGPGTFPPPAANLTQTSPIWRWSEVALWFADELGELDRSVAREATQIAALNAALELQRSLTSLSAINRLWSFGGLELKKRIK